MKSMFKVGDNVRDVFDPDRYLVYRSSRGTLDSKGKINALE